MTLISRCLSFPSRAAVVLLAAWALVTTSAGAATLTVSGSGLSVQGGASVCTYSSMSESGAGNWSVVCGSGSRTISINPPVNGTVCASYTSITESGLGNWTVQGCGSLSPTITLDAPSQSGQTYPTGTAFTLKATASAPSGRTVSSVQFYADGNLIHAGNLSGSQYVWDWTPATGTYLVLARVTDSTGATADSTARQMIFQPQGTVFYVHPDHLGTPRAITRASDNQVVWRWDNTEAFGNSAPNENPSGLGSFAYNLRFPGQYFDVETGTAYNYFRDYDPGIGRYIQSDPLGIFGGPSSYGYVSGAPLWFIDPLGLICEVAIWSGGSIRGWKPCDDERPNPGGSSSAQRPQPSWGGHVDLLDHVPPDNLCYPPPAPDPWQPINGGCYVRCLLAGLGSSLAVDAGLHGAGEGVGHQLGSEAAKKMIGRAVGLYSAYSIGKGMFDAKSVCTRACRGY